MAWIGLIDEVNNELVPAVVAGEDTYLSKQFQLKIYQGRGPVGTAIREEIMLFVMTLKTIF
jgi:hypothetical protein